MKNLGLGVALGTAALAAAVTPQAFAFPSLTLDDFAGGPHVVSLTSFAPPEIALGTFAHGAAVGGVRDVVVISETSGAFSAGVSFGAGGFASFSGSGRGGIVYDGVAGIADANDDKSVSIDELDFGLNLDLLGTCPDATIHVDAFADLPAAKLNILLASSATDWAEYTIDLTTVGAFADYYVSIFAPTVTAGAFDPTSVKAIAVYHDGGDFPNLDMRLQGFDVTCVPESGTWLAMGGLLGVAGLGWRQVRSAKA